MYEMSTNIKYHVKAFNDVKEKNMTFFLNLEFDSSIFAQHVLKQSAKSSILVHLLKLFELPFG